jgi:hypothetical protein
MLAGILAQRHWQRAQLRPRPLRLPGNGSLVRQNPLDEGQHTARFFVPGRGISHKAIRLCLDQFDHLTTESRLRLLMAVVPRNSFLHRLLGQLALSHRHGQ